MSIEKPGYTVLYQAGDIEYRQYEPYLVSETVIENTDNYDAAGNEGFRRLFSYISGGNQSRTKIAMTAPVTQAPAGEKIAMTAPVAQSRTGSGFAVSFMLPGKYTLDTAPVPNDSRVRIREVPGRMMAVLRYSGRWTNANFAERTGELLEAVARAGVDTIGEVESARYNAPYTPPFLRRNEVMIEISGLPAAAADAARPAQSD